MKIICYLFIVRKYYWNKTNTNYVYMNFNVKIAIIVC